MWPPLLLGTGEFRLLLVASNMVQQAEWLPVQGTIIAYHFLKDLFTMLFKNRAGLIAISNSGLSVCAR